MHEKVTICNRGYNYLDLFVNLVLTETCRAKFLAASSAVFLSVSLIIPNAGFAGGMPDNPPQNEAPIRFDKYAGAFIGAGEDDCKSGTRIFL